MSAYTLSNCWAVLSVWGWDFFFKEVGHLLSTLLLASFLSAECPLRAADKEPWCEGLKWQGQERVPNGKPLL